MKRTAALLAALIALSVAAEPNRWAIDPSESHIAFTAEQAQAPFEGSFRTFDADVRFDPNALGESSAQVSIDTGSVTTADKERDGILKGAEWFESEQFPRATFVAKKFVKTPDGFEARGQLTVRTVSAPVTLHFTLTETDGRVELRGEADLDRFAFDLGLGDWADTKWIGKNVRVRVTLVATR